MGSEQLSELHEALGESQRLGFLGDRAIDEVVEHARLFVTALDGLQSTHGGRPKVVDLGSGGGVPGLVIAYYRPDVLLTLLDRRTKRTDFLRRVVSRFGWNERVDVVVDDATNLVRSQAGLFDGAVARGFGPPDSTLTIAAALIRPGGRAVISEPPQGDRWSPGLLEQLGVERLPSKGRVAVFELKRDP
jgi:16S rRNA (guanine527-N7)-methyltransferase